MNERNASGSEAVNPIRQAGLTPRPQPVLDRLRTPGPFFLAWASLLLFAGCAGYRLGPTNGMVAGEKSVTVRPFQNKTDEPRLSAAVVQSMRKSLQQDGTYRLNTRGEGDVVVSGAIVGYYRSAVSFQPEDVITPRDYRISMTAQVRAVERSTGRVLLDREVVGRTTVRVGPDQVSAERQAIPLLADDLAWHTTSLLVDGDF